MNNNENNENDNEELNSISQTSEMDIDESTIIKSNKNSKKRKKHKKVNILKESKNIFIRICNIFIIILTLLILAYCITLFILSLKNNNINQVLENINDVDVAKVEDNLNDKNDINITNNMTIENNISSQIEETISKFEFNSTHKLKIAFIYPSLYANGIARFISVTANNFIKTDKYEIYVVTNYKYKKDFFLDKRIHHLIAKNRTLIKNATQNLNLDFIILQNVGGKSTYDFYKKLCKKVIGMFHGLYMSAMFHGSIGPYKSWTNFDVFDAFIIIGYDDYFFYKNLGMKNEIFIPNLYTFEPSEVQSSNLTGHNIVMLGRAADKVKGYYYAIKTMPLIVKEVPDAKLIILSSNPKINNLQEYAKNLSVYNNIIFNQYTANISEVFWNSSVLMYTSLSEAFPLAMIEGKAHGLPVAAFDVAYSPPYHKGVIGVDMLDCESLAKETVKLLKDYNYRKKMGEESKKSLDQFSNNETILLWERLFSSLMEGVPSYRKLQKEIEDKYYNPEKARERMEKRFRDLIRLNKNFTCHSIINFTDINYVKKVKMCTFNKTENKDNNNSQK